MLGRSIDNRSDLATFITASGGGPYYVYVLRRPDGNACFGGIGTPFYVGKGKDARLFDHEEEARDPMRSSAKLDTIRTIWSAGGEVVRTIDSVHPIDPWDREHELMDLIGRAAEGVGPLVNAQGYSPSVKLDGVELRKYAADHIASGDLNAIPPRFRLRHIRLMAGPREPRSQVDVFRKIFDVARDNPGVTGERLVELLRDVDFTANKSAYTQAGQVSASWLVGYIEGAYFRSDRQHLQEYRQE